MQFLRYYPIFSRGATVGKGGGLELNSEDGPAQ